MILVRSVIFIALAAAAIWYFLAEPDRRAEQEAIQSALQAEAELRAESLTAILRAYERATVLVARSVPVVALVKENPETSPQPLTESNADNGTDLIQPATTDSGLTIEQALDELRSLETLTGLEAIRVLKEGADNTLPPVAPPADLLADGRWQAGIDAAFQGELGQVDIRNDNGAPLRVFFTPIFNRPGVPAIVIAEAPLGGVKSLWMASDYDLALTNADGEILLSKTAYAGADPIVVSHEIPALGAVLTVSAAGPNPVGPWAIRSAAAMLIAILALLAWEVNLARRRLRTEMTAMQRAEVLLHDEEVRMRKVEPERSTDELGSGEDLALVVQVSDLIGHEINKPLSAIRNHAEAAVRSVDKGEMDAARDNIEHVSTLADRIWRIIGNMRGFVPSQPYQLEPVSIRPLVHNAAVDMLERDPALGDYFFMEEADDLPEKTFVRADKTRLEQVLDSLLSSCWDVCRGQEAPELVISIRQSQADIVVAIDYGQRSGGPVAPSGRVSVGEVADAAGPVGAGVSFSIAKSFVEGMGGKLMPRESALGGGRIEIVLPKFRTQQA